MYTPTDEACERVYTPGVFVFPLCPTCAPQLMIATPASVALVAELRQLAFSGRST